MSKIEPTTLSPSTSISTLTLNGSEVLKKGINSKLFKKPKRNKSAFILFSIQMRESLKQNSLTSLNSNEMMVKLGELWKNLDQFEKRKFILQAEQDKDRYHKELLDFQKENPTEFIKNRTKKNYVKKPCSSYALFVKEMKGEIKESYPQLKMADLLKIISQRWRSLSKKEKLSFEEKAAIEKQIASEKKRNKFLKTKKLKLTNNRVQSETSVSGQSIKKKDRNSLKNSKANSLLPEDKETNSLQQFSQQNLNDEKEEYQTVIQVGLKLINLLTEDDQKKIFFPEIEVLYDFQDRCQFDIPKGENQTDDSEVDLLNFDTNQHSDFEKDEDGVFKEETHSFLFNLWETNA